MLLMLGRIVAGSRIRQTLPLTASLATVRHRKIADLPPRYDDGRGDRIRTCDPLVPNQVRYQPAPLPDGAAVRRSFRDTQAPFAGSRG